ncbi:MAG TPA: hypothetical protein VMB50_21505 [Myxococcales bacterium]|nr:hypothetical protein [Myxococcales bacterium]
MKKGLFAVAALAAIGWGVWRWWRSLPPHVADSQARLIVHAAACSLREATAQHDFDAICVAFDASNRLLAGRDPAALGDAEQARVWAPIFDVEDELCVPNAIVAMRLMGSVPPEKKYLVFQMSAKEAGLAGWTCPAMEQSFRAK